MEPFGDNFKKAFKVKCVLIQIKLKHTSKLLLRTAHLKWNKTIKFLRRGQVLLNLE